MKFLSIKNKKKDGFLIIDRETAQPYCGEFQKTIFLDASNLFFKAKEENFKIDKENDSKITFKQEQDIDEEGIYSTEKSITYEYDDNDVLIRTINHSNRKASEAKYECNNEYAIVFDDKLENYVIEFESKKLKDKEDDDPEKTKIDVSELVNNYKSFENNKNLKMIISHKGKNGKTPYISLNLDDEIVDIIYKNGGLIVSSEHSGILKKGEEKTYKTSLYVYPERIKTKESYVDMYNEPQM